MSNATLPRRRVCGLYGQIVARADTVHTAQIRRVLCEKHCKYFRHVNRHCKRYIRVKRDGNYRDSITRDQNVKIRSPIWSPGAIWSPIWSSDEACFSSHLFKRPLIFAQKAQLQSNLVTQEQSGRPEAIWSPIRSLGHQVVDLVVVDAFSSSICIT